MGSITRGKTFSMMSIQDCEENCSIDEMSKIVYVKHNVRDEYDELTVSTKISVLSLLATWCGKFLKLSEKFCLVLTFESKFLHWFIWSFFALLFIEVWKYASSNICEEFLGFWTWRLRWGLFFRHHSFLIIISNGPGSVSVRFGFFALKPNRTEPNHLYKTKTKPNPFWTFKPLNQTI